MKQNKLILLLLICTLLPTTAHAGWRETALKTFSGGKTTATSVAKEQLPSQTAAARSVNPAALAPLHLQLPPMPSTSDLSAAYEATAKRTQQLRQAGLLPAGMPPSMATVSVLYRNLERVLQPPFPALTVSVHITNRLATRPFQYQTKKNSLRPTDFYPSIPGLQKRLQGLQASQQQEALAHEIADNQNALYVHFVTEIAPKIRKRVQELYPQFEQVANDWAKQQPENPVTWVAQQVPTDTDNLVIGEIHLDEIPQAMIPMLDVLTERMNGREIIFLTEFLPKGHVLDVEHDLDMLDQKPIRNFRKRNYPLWKALHERNIPVIGLEPEFVEGSLEDECLATACDFYAIPEEYSAPVPTDVWVNQEGLRIRNQHWLEEIQNQRKAHPNALFIIYAGKKHTSYLEPFSIARELPGKKFVIEVLSKGFAPDLENLLISKQMPDCFPLTDPQLAQAAGFDALIKIPK